MAAIEFAIIAPIMSALILGCVTLFVLFRSSEIAEKATFTVADIVSRQTTVSNSSLKIIYDMFEQMVPVNSSDIKFRISSVKKSNGKLTVDWSYAVLPFTKMTTADIPADSLPVIANGDSMVLCETRVNYIPMFESVGLPSGSHFNLAVNRPRFTSAILKTD